MTHLLSPVLQIYLICHQCSRKAVFRFISEMPATSDSVFEAFLTVVVIVAKLNSDSDKLRLSLSH
jgi:hypothetical protein